MAENASKGPVCVIDGLPIRSGMDCFCGQKLTEGCISKNQKPVSTPNVD